MSSRSGGQPTNGTRFEGGAERLRAAGSDELILYVDDDGSNRVVFEHAVGNAFKVSTAESAAEALAFLEQRHAAVLITDQRMPEMSGNELLRVVKERWPSMVRIVVTAYSDFDRLMTATNDGLVARWVVKPWEPAELRALLRWALEKYRMTRDDAAMQLRLQETERLATVGSFAACILHDVSQPLMAISTNADHLAFLTEGLGQIRDTLHSLGDQVPEEAREGVAALSDDVPEVVDDIQASARILEAIIKQLRVLVNPQRSALDEKRSTHHAIESALRMCDPVAAENECLLLFGGPKTLPPTRLTDAALTQVLVNLLANGVEAVRRAKKTRGFVRVGVRQEGDTLLFDVEDNGAGMPRDVLERVGTSFFSTREGGTGMGVTQSRRLVEAVGGTLKLHSTEGIGTSVVFKVPVIDGDDDDDEVAVRLVRAG